MICRLLLTKDNSGDEIKEDEMVGTCSMYGRRVEMPDLWVYVGYTQRKETIRRR